MSALDTLNQAIKASRNASIKSYREVYSEKGSSAAITQAMSPGNPFEEYSSQAKYKQYYSLFKGWLFPAIDSVGHKAASQIVKVGKMKGKTKSSKLTGNKNASEKKEYSNLKAMSDYTKGSMPPSIRMKAAEQILEIQEDHPIIDVLENPNPIQSRWQFVYMFIANLALTGWGFVVKDQDEEGNPQFYAVPTTWVRPVHKKGPFAQFRLADPNSPQSQQDDDKGLLDRSQVEFAYLPNPGNMKQAYAPTTSQIESVKINDYIQYSRLDFFRQGINPNVILTIGKDPHPDADREGIRPRLTAAQRRQVISTIQKSYGGVANWSHPAIIDGLVEKIERLSMTNEEMGWDRSEKSIKRAILSIYGIHDFILGGDVPGSYAQAREIKEVFFGRVNSYLDQLSIVITKLARSHENDTSILVWWEKCIAEDPQQKNQLFINGRKNNDITQNEYRAHLGLPPDADRNECVIGVGQIPHVKEMITRVVEGKATEQQAIAFFEAIGIPSDFARTMAKPPEEPVESNENTPRITQEPFSGPQNEDEAQNALEGLQAAMDELRRTDYGNSRKVARMIVGQIQDMRK